jgi:hypothetical protein
MRSRTKSWDVLFAQRFGESSGGTWAGQGCEIPNFKGS